MTTLDYKYLCMGCKDNVVVLHHSQYFRTVYCDNCLDKPDMPFDKEVV